MNSPTLSVSPCYYCGAAPVLHETVRTEFCPIMGGLHYFECPNTAKDGRPFSDHTCGACVSRHSIGMAAASWNAMQERFAAWEDTQAKDRTARTA